MIVGIIAEYNPFHNGHFYQINKIKSNFPNSSVVVVMSSDFVQRGDAAIIDKFARAKMAISCGVDLVLELPSLFSLRSADGFAKSGVQILDSLGLVDIICFGSECGDVKKLSQTAETLINKKSEIKEISKNLAKTGKSFAAQRGEAVEQILGENLSVSPNDILGIEYIKALKELKSTISPHVILRHKVSHDSSKALGEFASASYIRKKILEGDTKCLLNLMPKPSLDILLEKLLNNEAPVTIKPLEKAIIANLKKLDAKTLKNISGCSEGLENRIKKAADNSVNLLELIGSIKTKRYTESRVKRTVLNSFLNFTKESEALKPEYIRVLGLNDAGAEILKRAKNTATLPIITKLADANFEEGSDCDIILKAEHLAADMYSMLIPNPKLQKSGRNFNSAYFKKT